MIFGLGMEEVGGLACCLCTLGMLPAHHWRATHTP